LRRAAGSASTGASRSTAAPNPSATIKPQSSGIASRGKFSGTAKILRDREIEPVAKLAVLRPLDVAAEILHGGLHLHDQQLAGAPERHHVRPAPVGERDLGQAGVAALGQRTANASGQQEAERKVLDGGVGHEWSLTRLKECMQWAIEYDRAAPARNMGTPGI
jgi:hypothetical protein